MKPKAEIGKQLTAYWTTSNAGLNMIKNESNEMKEERLAKADPQVKALEDERSKMHQAGTLAKTNSRFKRLVKQDRIKDFTYKHGRKHDGRRFVDADLLLKIVKMHPFFPSIRRVAKFAGLREGEYQCLLKSGTRVKKLSPRNLKKIADALELENWVVLVDKEAERELVGKSDRAEKYLRNIHELEKKIMEEKKDFLEESFPSFVGEPDEELERADQIANDLLTEGE